LTLVTGAGSQYRLTNLTVSGAITGDAVNNGACFFFATNSRLQGATTLTSSGTGTWTIALNGRANAALNSVGGFCQAITVAGIIQTAGGWAFQSTVSFSGAVGNNFADCQFVNGSFTYTGATTCRVFLRNCGFTNAMTFNGSGAGSLTVMTDDVSEKTLMQVGAQYTGTAQAGGYANHFTSGAASASFTGTVTTNATLTLTVSSGTLNRLAEGLYEVVFDCTNLAVGVGTVNLNLTYTDMTGTLVTVPVSIAGVTQSLNIANAVGTKVAASMPFHHNGDAAVPILAIAGIVSGASIAVGASIRRVS